MNPHTHIVVKTYLSLIVDVRSLHDKLLDTLKMATVGSHHQRCGSKLKTGGKRETVKQQLYQARPDRI